MNQVISLKPLKLSCQQCSLSLMCLPRGLSHQEFEQLDKIIRHEFALEKGDYLFEVGQPFRSLYVVRTGSVKIFQSDSNGDEQVVGFHMPGEILGLDAMTQNRHACNAVALEPCTICEMPYARLDELAQQIPGLYKHLLSQMSNKLVADYEIIARMVKKSAEERIATFLLSISNCYSKRGFSPYQFNLTMSRNDIGNYLGLAVETISRCITHMQDQKIIRVNRKYTHILNMTRLREIAGIAEHEYKITAEGIE